MKNRRTIAEWIVDHDDQIGGTILFMVGTGGILSFLDWTFTFLGMIARAFT